MSKLQLYDSKITKIFKVLRFGRLQMFSYQSFPALSVICAAPRWIRGFVVEVFFWGGDILKAACSKNKTVAQQKAENTSCSQQLWDCWECFAHQLFKVLKVAYETRNRLVILTHSRPRVPPVGHDFKTFGLDHHFISVVSFYWLKLEEFIPCEVKPRPAVM